MELEWNMSTGSIYNDPQITERFAQKVRAAGLSVQAMPARMSSEDFAWFLEKAPGLIFRFGTRNEALGCTALAHRNDFKIDESGMKTAIRAFIAYILQ